MTVLAQIGSENVSKFTCILYWYCVVIDGGHCVGREDKVLIQALEIISSHAKMRSEEGKEDKGMVCIFLLASANPKHPLVARKYTAISNVIVYLYTLT